MLASALGALSDRLDSKFLTAYWVPAFVGFLCSLAILGYLAGSDQLVAWIYDLGSVGQTLAILIVVLVVTMAAYILRALSRPIAEVFAGDALPSIVAAWSTRGQRGTRQRMDLAQRVPAAPLAADGEMPAPGTIRQRLTCTFPIDDNDMRPTLLGNILETAAEHPRIAYTMEGLIWWPRLSPLVPSYFQDMLGGAQAPMMGLLNLSVIFAGVALGGGSVLVLAGRHWTAALVTFVGGLILTRLCYRAAVSQATEVASLMKVGFDLYRHEILRQMDIEIPLDLADERALWIRLSAELLGLPADGAPGGDDAGEETP